MQDVYNIEELNNINPQSNLYKVPHDSFIGSDPPPLKFQTRDCYPIQNDSFRQRVSERLMQLRFFTDLTFPVNRVCFVYDEIMMQHKNKFDAYHPEQPERILKIKQRFEEYNLINRMKHLSSRAAKEEELALVHTQAHITLMKEIVERNDLDVAGDSYNSIYFHEKTYESAIYAAGSVLQVVDEVLNGRSRSGVCVIRPPGHHSESDECHGFCIFNNVSVAAQYAIKNHGLKRVLIVDWDIHHGNGTQHIFDESNEVLYISIHRYDHGNFFPRSKDADFCEVGSGVGKGFNVNIPWNKKGMGDMEYILAMQNIVLPIAYDFDPELVIVSAGFDAAIGDHLGGCKVSPEAYGYFTHWLSALANGRIILVLEGGYNVNSISHAMTMCTKSLLGDPLPMIQISSRFNGINASALESIQNVIGVQEEFWKCLKFNRKLPDFDVNENKLEDELIKAVDGMKLNTTPHVDADECGGNSRNVSSDNCAPGTSSNAAVTSGGSDNKVTLLVDFLSDNLEALNNEEMYAIVPLKSCPHLALLKPDDAPSGKFKSIKI